MNKRYIDFVPVKKGEVARSAKVIMPTKAVAPSKSTAPVSRTPARATVLAKSRSNAPARPVRTKVATAGAQMTKTPTKPRTRAEVNVAEVMAERKYAAGVTRRVGPAPKYGVIEDYKPRFVQAEVQKRPLSNRARSTASELKDVLIDAKQKKLVEKAGPLALALTKAGALTRSKKEAIEAKKEAKKEAKLVKTPRMQFVNMDKIDKRPLSKNSKNVYKKKAFIPPEEDEPSGPVTIIDKPEKDSKVGMIVAIILTIILGAAAGTVAFLLLPK